MTVRVVALGDSTSCGEGVGLRLPAAATWPARLAAAVPQSELIALATAGARVRDVLEGQAAVAAAAQPHLVTLLVGLNDVSRRGFSADAFARDLGAVIRLLRPTGTHVLLGRLHDPTLLLPLPAALRGPVRARAAAVNAAVDALAAASPSQVSVLDLALVPGLRLRRSWDVDRLHPNAAGHALIAAEAARVLRGAGLLVGRPVTEPLPPAPGVLREATWALRSGLPWFLAHAREVVGPALRT